MIVVNKTNQNRTIKLQDFYEVKGLLRSYSVGVGALFDWKKDHGIITGSKDQIHQIQTINGLFKEKKHFANLTILTKWDYDHKKCTTKFQNPCPYFHAALSSLVMPTALSLICFLIMTSCTKGSMQGM